MATAGWPLRRETFYFSHRQHGPHYLPFDATELIQDLLPGPLTEDEDDWLCGRGHHMGGAWRQAIQGSVRVEALPRGSWFFDREPAFSITGPSSLVSWLEPLVVQLNYRIQLSSLAKLDPEALPEAVAVASCEAQAEIVRETLDAVGVAAPPIRVDSEGYVAGVQQRLQALIDIVGDPARIFEVGLRTATCTE